MAVITAFDEKGKMLGRSGDEPLADDVYNVNQSRTAGDPMLRVKAPGDAKSVVVTVEDLALRGGAELRLPAQRAIGGAGLSGDLECALRERARRRVGCVPVTVQRQGFDGEVQLRVANAPQGPARRRRLRGGGRAVKETPQNRNSRGMLILTAEPGAALAPVDLIVEGVGKLPDGTSLVRRAEGAGDDRERGGRDRAGFGGPAAAVDRAMAGIGPARRADQAAGRHARSDHAGAQADGRGRSDEVPLEVEPRRMPR